jgi:hypothetical protein
MDKNIIKSHLIKRFLSEDATPGISVTDKAKKESGKINKAGVAAVEKDVKSYDKSLKQENPDNGKMAKNKYNYTDDAEKTYHDEMEILNGQEMIEYASEPGAEFKKRAEESLEGSTRMGNKIGGNAEAVWGASSDDFGKDLIKRVKDSSKKRAEAEIQTYGMGDVQIPTGNKVQVATTAVSSGKPKGDTTKATQSASEKIKTKVVKENKEKEKDSEEFNDGEDYEKISREVEYGVNPNADNKKDNNNKPKIKESMKRLNFKKEFEGSNTTQKIGHALTLIPESFRTDKKEFEMTDGNVTCKIRWEGNLNEGKAVVLLSSNKALVSEDMTRMKALMGYKSQDTLGLVKGKSRVDENAAFGDIWKKTKKLLGESEEIEGADAAEGDLDDAVNQAPEAKKHVEGSVSTEKGTKAPAPKTGDMASLDKVVKHAAEAKKHVEGSVATEKKTEAPAPKVGNWEEIKKAQAPEAKKDIESGTATHKATDTAKVVKENFGEENDSEEEGPEPEDNYNKPDADDDDSSMDAEPSANDIKGDVPPAVGGDDDDVVVPTVAKGGPRVFKNPAGEHFFLQNGKHVLRDTNNQPMAIPAQYVELAKKNPAAVIEKMEAEAENGSEEIDEYGDEHQVSTKDAVSGMKPGAVKEYGDEHPVATKDAVAGMKTGK